MPSNHIGDMVVKIVGDNSGLDKSINDSQKKFEAFGNMATKVGGALTLGLTAPILAAGVASLKSAGQFQLYQASFETMLGSAEKASALIGDMQKLAAATPFELGDIAGAGKTLLQFGVDAEKVLPTIKSIGDIAQGESGKFQSLSLAFGQMSSTGRLMGQDLLQMINAGFNPLLEISKHTGVSMGELKKQMEKGRITAGMVADSFKRASSEGGQFFNGMEKASRTLPGLISTLKDDVGTLGRSFVEDLTPQVMEGVKGLSNLAKTFTDLDKPTKAFILTMLGFAAAAGPVSLAIGTISKALLFLAANPLVAVIAGIGTLIGLALSLKSAMDAKYLEDVGKRYGELSKKIGVVPEKIDDINAALLNQSGNTLPGLSAQIDIMAQKWKTTRDSIIAIALSSQNVTGEYKRQFETLQQQAAAQKAYANASNIQAHKAEIDAEKITAENARQKKLEEERLNLLKQSRNVLVQEYQTALSNTNKKLQAGLIDSKKAYEENYEATKDYAEGLALLGYTGNEINGVLNVGNGLLKEAKRLLAEYGKVAGEGFNKTALSFNATAISFKTFNANINEVTQNFSDASRVWVGVSQAISENWAITVEEMKKKGADWRATISEIGKEIKEAITSSLVELGEQLVGGELSWKSFADIALLAISDILAALGNQLIAISVLKAATGDMAGALLAAGGAAAAFVASGMAKGMTKIKEETKKATLSLKELRKELDTTAYSANDVIENLATYLSNESIEDRIEQIDKRLEEIRKKRELIGFNYGAKEEAKLLKRRAEAQEAAYMTVKNAEDELSDSIQYNNEKLRLNKALFTESRFSALAYKTTLSNLSEAAVNFSTSLQSVGTTIADNLIDNLSEGLGAADFGQAMKKFITKMVIQAAVYTDQVKEQIAGIGTRLASYISGGVNNQGALQSIKNELGALYSGLERKAQGATAILDSVFGVEEKESTPEPANREDSRTVGVSDSNLSGNAVAQVTSESMYHLIVNLDSRPFLDTIFPATRNRTVLISAGAIV